MSGAPARALLDKRGEHPAVVAAHVRTIRVENARNANLRPMLGAIAGHQGFGEPLALVIAGPGPDRIDVAPVRFALRVFLGVAVDLACAGVQETRSVPARELKQLPHPAGARG